MEVNHRNTGSSGQMHTWNFLNRDPDSRGLAFWTREMARAATNAPVHSEQAHQRFGGVYLSIDFNKTGYLVERITQSAYGKLQ